MTIFLLWFRNFQSELELIGLYSTREKAQTYIDNAGDDKSQMEITEEEVE